MLKRIVKCSLPNTMTTRRDFLTVAAGSLLLAGVPNLFGQDAEKKKEPWKIGICDWDLRARGRIGSFAVAKELGFEGVQVTYHPDGTDSLAVKENRPKYLAAAKENGVAIASFCIGHLNQEPLATTREAEGWVADCLEAMEEMEVEQVLIPFFGNGNMEEHKDQQPFVIEKFKRLAPIAERKKKILAIESYLTAEDHIKMIEAIGSDAVKVYYDTRNSLNVGYDIFSEMELLGTKKLISQVHFKDNTRLGGGDIDFTKVRETLGKAGYEGWGVVESSVSGDWKESHIENAQFLKKLFGR